MKPGGEEKDPSIQILYPFIPIQGHSEAEEMVEADTSKDGGVEMKLSSLGMVRGKANRSDTERRRY